MEQGNCKPSLSWLLTGIILSSRACSFHSPKLRMSFITYAAQGSTVMSLTSDR